MDHKAIQIIDENNNIVDTFKTYTLLCKLLKKQKNRKSG